MWQCANAADTCTFWWHFGGKLTHCYDGKRILRFSWCFGDGGIVEMLLTRFWSLWTLTSKLELHVISDLLHGAPQQSLVTAMVLMQATKCLTYLLGQALIKMKRQKFLGAGFLK